MKARDLIIHGVTVTVCGAALMMLQGTVHADP